MIKSKRTALRALKPEDADLYEVFINDEETNVWRGLYHPTSQAEASQWLQNQMTHTSDRMTLAIEVTEGESPRTIGFIGLRGICPRSRRAEIWIYIGDKAMWGKGYGPEATWALCDYAFDEMNLFRLWLECDPEYAPAVRCYERIGFKREGLLRKAYYRRGEFRDTCMMGLLRTDRTAPIREEPYIPLHLTNPCGSNF